jgi:hypothetical protein
MSSKFLAFVVLAAGCVTAAGTGAYFAVRQNAPAPVAAQTISPAAAPQAAASPAAAAGVAETEATVATEPAPATPPVSEVEAPAVPRTAATEPVERKAPARRANRTRAVAPVASSTAPARAPQSADRIVEAAPALAPELPPVPTTAEVPLPEPTPLPPLVLYEDVVVPAASVIGLRVETALTSERAQVEDRVEARVTRDVTADGRVAIPAGARAIGSVTLVERGGKMKERARLGVRFHTLVLADGREVPMTTDAIFREGDSPSAESARKIGGAAAGGAILGALLGGKKGAVMGGAAGAGAGTAAVMASGRNAAAIASGTVLTVRLSAPVSIEVEKR